MLLFAFNLILSFLYLFCILFYCMGLVKRFFLSFFFYGFFLMLISYLLFYFIPYSSVSSSGMSLDRFKVLTYFFSFLISVLILFVWKIYYLTSKIRRVKEKINSFFKIVNLGALIFFSLILLLFLITLDKSEKGFIPSLLFVVVVEVVLLFCFFYDKHFDLDWKKKLLKKIGFKRDKLKDVLNFLFSWDEPSEVCCEADFEDKLYEALLNTGEFSVEKQVKLKRRIPDLIVNGIPVELKIVYNRDKVQAAFFQAQDYVERYNSDVILVMYSIDENATYWAKRYYKERDVKKVHLVIKEGKKT